MRTLSEHGFLLASSAFRKTFQGPFKQAARTTTAAMCKGEEHDRILYEELTYSDAPQRWFHINYVSHRNDSMAMLPQRWSHTNDTAAASRPQRHRCDCFTPVMPQQWFHCSKIALMTGGRRCNFCIHSCLSSECFGSNNILLILSYWPPICSGNGREYMQIMRLLSPMRRAVLEYLHWYHIFQNMLW